MIPVLSLIALINSCTENLNGATNMLDFRLKLELDRSLWYQQASRSNQAILGSFEMLL